MPPQWFFTATDPPEVGNTQVASLYLCLLNILSSGLTTLSTAAAAPAADAAAAPAADAAAPAADATTAAPAAK